MPDTNHIKVLSELFVPQSKSDRNSRNKKNDPYDNIGQKLVGLVAAKLDDNSKDTNSSNSSKEQHIIDILHQLEMMIRRRGLYWDQSALIVNQDDVDEIVVMDDNFNKRHGNKRQKMQPKLSSQETTSNEELILLGITRILNSNNKHTNSLSPFTIEASANVILALADEINTTASISNNTKKSCMQLELIAKYTSQWVSSFANHLEFLFQQMVGTTNTTTFYFGVPTTHETNNTTCFVASDACWTSGAIICLNAVSSLVTYVGVPRVAKIVPAQVIQKLKSTAWRIMGCLCTTEETSLISSASKLIVSLSQISITSNTNKIVLLSWSECFLRILSEIALVLYRAYPPIHYRGAHTLDWAEKHYFSRQQLDDSIPQENQWLNNLAGAIPLQDERATAIYHRLYALSKLLISYMNYGGGVSVIYFPLTSFLDTCELLLKFGGGAENRYSNNKSTKANFNIPDENALLSLKHTVEIMNDVRFLGHSIFVSSLTAIGPTLMLPQAKRIASLVEVALLSSCSLQIQQLLRSTISVKVVPANNNSNSIALRAKAIRTAKVSMLTLGSGATPMLSKSMQLIAGCLLERMIIDDKSDCSWGSHSERENLIKESFEALSAFVCVGGRVLPLVSRSKLEEVVRSCLDKLIVTRGTTACSEVKAAFLKLGMDVVSNPWIDGGISNLLPDFVQMGKLFQRDRDPNVVSLAFSLVNICNSIATPRSLPLVSVVNRATNRLPSLEEELRINVERKQRREKPSQTLTAAGQQENSQNTTFVISQNEKEQSLAESKLAGSLCSSPQTHTSDVKVSSEEVISISADEGTNSAPTNVAVDNIAGLERITLSKDSSINNNDCVDSLNPLSVSHEAEKEDPLHDSDNNNIMDSGNDAMGYRSEKTILNSTNKHNSFSRKFGDQEEEEDDDEDYFPEIIDCDPDEGD